MESLRLCAAPDSLVVALFMSLSRWWFGRRCWANMSCSSSESMVQRYELFMFLPNFFVVFICCVVTSSILDTKKGVGSASGAYPGNMGLRIASTIRISNYRPTPARISKCRTDGLHTSDFAIRRTTQTLRCSACHGFDFCEVSVPTGQTLENVFLI